MAPFMVGYDVVAAAVAARLVPDGELGSIFRRALS